MSGGGGKLEKERGISNSRISVDRYELILFCYWNRSNPGSLTDLVHPTLRRPRKERSSFSPGLKTCKAVAKAEKIFKFIQKNSSFRGFGFPQKIEMGETAAFL